MVKEGTYVPDPSKPCSPEMVCLHTISRGSPSNGGCNGPESCSNLVTLLLLAPTEFESQNGDVHIGQSEDGPGKQELAKRCSQLPVVTRKKIFATSKSGVVGRTISRIMAQ